MFDVGPPRPARKGRLLLLMLPLLEFVRGTPLLVGMTAPLGFAKGICPLTAELVTMPVMALADGFDPPSTSCMKKIKGWWGSECSTVALPVAAPLAPVCGAAVGATADGVAGFVTGATTGLDESGTSSAAGASTGSKAGAAAGVATGGSSSRIRAEVAHVMAIANKNRQTVDLSVAMGDSGCELRQRG